MEQKHYDRILVELLKQNGHEFSSGPDIHQLDRDDWDMVVQQAIWHSVAAPLYERIGFVESDSLTPKAKKRLKTLYHYNQWNNTGIHSKLQVLLKEMNRRKIPVIALKGAHLVALVYQNYALRAMSDIDLLIHKNDVEQIEEILFGMGYTVVGDKERYDKTHFHFIYQHREPGFKSHIELHWDLHSANTPITIDLDNVWLRAQPATIAQEQILVLCPEDFLIHQCLHLAVQHCFEFGLRPLYDIKKTLSFYQDSLKWDEFLIRVREWNLQKSVFLTLLLTQRLMQSKIPEKVMAKLELDDMDPQFIESAINNIFQSRTEASSHVSSNLTLIISKKSLVNRIKSILAAIFLPPDLLRQRYFLPPKSRRVWFYYPIRIKDILIRHMSSLFGFLRKDSIVLEQVRKEKSRHDLRKWLDAEENDLD